MDQLSAYFGSLASLPNPTYCTKAKIARGDCPHYPECPAAKVLVILCPGDAGYPRVVSQTPAQTPAPPRGPATDALAALVLASREWCHACDHEAGLHHATVEGQRNQIEVAEIILAAAESDLSLAILADAENHFGDLMFRLHAASVVNGRLIVRVNDSTVIVWQNAYGGYTTNLAAVKPDAR